MHMGTGGFRSDFNEKMGAERTKAPPPPLRPDAIFMLYVFARLHEHQSIWHTFRSRNVLVVDFALEKMQVGNHRPFPLPGRLVILCVWKFIQFNVSGKKFIYIF